MQKLLQPESPLTPCNCLALRQAARHVSQIYEAHLAAEGLRASQYSILSALGRGGPMAIGALARAMVMDRTTLGRALRPLERDGFLEIAPGPDGRTRSLRLTPAGETKLAAAAIRWREAQAEFETSFGTQAAAELRDTLRQVVVRTGERGVHG
ncbi:MarR family winged helix-turn-helix transcriptional regulator [Bosea beijingensis]|uniref:MarR family winged helix-turn-helix transcriptional regulator n=1 Tax=Bosea beijingensis TaxID=3068632 RepID=UPI0027421CA5|nr:MarR family winged helix-turn-helix transcriptional regulator [Bosea sp. REN20]